jgi:hypothetical protein
MKTSDTIGQVGGALAAAQGEMAGAKRDGLNDHYGNRYPTLESLLEAAKPALSKNGISVLQASGSDAIRAVKGDSVVVGSVTTRLVHKSGEWIETTLRVPLADRLTYQEVGKALTYLRRYSLAGLVGIAGEVDDDGETDLQARKRSPDPPAPRKRSAPSAAPKPSPSREADAPAEQVIEGTIDDVRKTPTPNGGTKWGVLVKSWEPGWSSTFDENIGPWLEERVGREVRLTVRKSKCGRFWNLADAVEITPSGGTVDPLADIPF